MPAVRRLAESTGSQRLARARPAPQSDLLRRWSLLSLVAGLLVAAVQLFAPFDHGVWLVAYLLLVGSLAAFLLGTGEAALLEDRPSEGWGDAQAVLWALGTIAVPAGVLGERRAAVALGSAALLAALGSMAAATLRPSARAQGSGGRVLACAYAALLLFMAGSVGIGLDLAWDIPWL